MNNSGIILTLAYPDTIVKISDEKFAPYFRFLGIGKKNYVRAGHAALVLIEKEIGSLEYFDFGRYMTPQGFGRVRGKHTDCELDFPIKAEMVEGKIKNLGTIIQFFATNSKLTHGTGKMVASICDAIDYEKARAYIKKMQELGMVKYAVFTKNASNCSRLVTDTLIASTTRIDIKKRLIKSNKFTPSTVGNIVNSTTTNQIFEVSEKGEISEFSSTPARENVRCFLDRLHGYKPNLIGNLIPKPVAGVHKNAQWLEGIGAGAWFELHNTSDIKQYKFRRISPYGNIDVDDVYFVNDATFNYDEPYQFVHYSNCKFFHVKQHEKTYRFERRVES